MTIRVRVTFEDQMRGRSWSVPGVEVPFERLTVGDLTDRVAETEAHLSRITGLIVKVETAMEE